MFEVRIHGRGGQGVVTGAELLSLAAHGDGLQAQAFPSFGSERMGAPVTAFCRLDDRPIRRREPIAEPDAVVVQDATLLHHVDVFGGLRADGCVLINSRRSPQELGLDELCARLGPGRVMTVPASEIAKARLGRPIPNVALLGGLLAMVGLVSPDSLEQAIGERFPGKTGRANQLAARDTHVYAAARLAPATAPAQVAS